MNPRGPGSAEVWPRGVPGDGTSAVLP